MKVAAVLALAGVSLLAASQSNRWPVEQPSGAALPPVLASVDRHSSTTDVPPEVLTKVVQRYCVVCHNDQLRTGNLSLEKFDVAAPHERWETAEKMIGKLRVQMMPPPGIPRPGGDTLLALVETLESSVGRYAAEHPNPGSRSFQRLNRAEYERAISDMFGLEVNAGEWLPPDQYLANFDNMAVSQQLSPTLLNAYLNAANTVARLAVGQPDAAKETKTYNVSTYESQHEWDHLEGAPYGTRGGLVVDHQFPADGNYVFEMSFWAGDHERDANLDISIDGERVALVPVEEYRRETDLGPNWKQWTEPIFVKAGQHKVAAAFIRKADGPYADLQEPFAWSNAGVRFRIGTGFTVLSHLRDLSILGPDKAIGVSEGPVRQRIFTCRPSSADAAESCAASILNGLATRAYRRPLTEADKLALLSFYQDGAKSGGFEAGIRTGIEAILASPYFVFRIENVVGAKPAKGENARLSDLALASRLSYFLWNAEPDQEVVDLAARGRLSDPKVLEQQARRMLADPRAEALGNRFAFQWLRLQDLAGVKPDAFWFPNFNEQIKQDMLRETEIFFNDLVRRDASVLDLYGSNYTFVNERLAKHYGIPNVVGEEFRRVEYPTDTARRGLLGQGSILMSTSMGTRTSPVLRGKWVMEVMLNAPPPPPPPGVPDLENTGAESNGRILTTRERLEIHRSSPVCRSCHQFMDPIGVAMENFGVTGEWRVREKGSPLDARGNLYDGTPLSSIVELNAALVKRPIPLVRTFTMNLMAYAIGRRTEFTDGPAIRAIAAQAEANGYKMSSFILGVVMSDQFRMRQEAGASGSGTPTAM